LILFTFYCAQVKTSLDKVRDGLMAQRVAYKLLDIQNQRPNAAAKWSSSRLNFGEPHKRDFRLTGVCRLLKVNCTV
jgi:hypothetical protein